MKYLLFLFLLISPVIFCSFDCTENSLLITKTIYGLLGCQILFDINFVETEGEYKLTISGLNLSFNPNTFDFVYVTHNVSLTGVVIENTSMDITTGTKVANAQLNYFSRYGFVN